MALRNGEGTRVSTKGFASKHSSTFRLYFLSDLGGSVSSSPPNGHTENAVSSVRRSSLQPGPKPVTLAPPPSSRGSDTGSAAMDELDVAASALSMHEAPPREAERAAADPSTTSAAGTGIDDKGEP